MWVAKVPNINDPAIEMTYVSPDKEEGFPGKVTLKVVYRLISTPKGDVVRMEYSATSTKATPFNPTNHAYFNLEGEGNGLITNHSLQIFADRAVCKCGGHAVRFPNSASDRSPHRC